MNTAKTLQLLDAQSNNISPATNIESLYYEVMDNGVIYRNSMYKHFPIYVKYNNNINDPIVINLTSLENNGHINLFTDTTAYSMSDTIARLLETSTFRLSQNSRKKDDIFVSSIRQSRLKNTRYYKLDISTYNFSDIMSLYAPKLWALKRFGEIDTSLNNIRYDSSLVTDALQAAIYTYQDVGGIGGNTDGTQLAGMYVNDIIDSLLFKETYPYIYDASIYMEKTETSTNVPINPFGLSDFDLTATTTYNILVNTGSLKIVYFNKSDVAPILSASSRLRITVGGNISNANISGTKTVSESKTLTLDDCREFYTELVDDISIDSSFPKNLNTGNNRINFENSIKQEDKNITFFTLYYNKELTDNDWNNIIKIIYPNYPDTNKDRNKVANLKTVFSEAQFFKNGYYKIVDTNVSIDTSISIKLPQAISSRTSIYKTNFGRNIGLISEAENQPCTNTPYSNIYESYNIPYNDYMYGNVSTPLIVSVNDSNIPKVNTSILLTHKVIINIPIIIYEYSGNTNLNNAITYITGIGSLYIEYLQDPTKDIKIYIPSEIDAAINTDTNINNINNIKLPEFYSIELGGVSVAANNWIIDSILYHRTYENNDTIITDYVEYTDGNTSILNPTNDEKKEYNMFNIYKIKAPCEFGGKRLIKIKIETK